MFQRFAAMRERREGGFTLIELLVVILIVAILAAVAIPVFLRQREKGYRDQMESALKNASTAVESYAVDNNGNYLGIDGATCDATGVCTDGSGPGTDPGLDLQGFSPTVDVTVTVSATDTTFCIDAIHESTTDLFHYDSAVGAPEEGACT